MPLGTKTAQTDSDAKLRRFFRQKLIDDLCRQVKETQGQIIGTKMGSFVGNDQNTLLYDFMQKKWNKMQKNMKWFQKPFLNDLQCKKTLWTVLNARRLETEAAKCAVDTQQTIVKQTQ